MHNDPNSEAEKAVLETALSWHVRLMGGDAGEADWIAFTQWLEADPAHNTAYDNVALAWDAVDEFAPAKARTESTNPDSNVVSLDLEKSRKSKILKPWALGAGFSAIAAALALVLIAPSYFGHDNPIVETQYTTAIGEQKTINLADGSTVHLNTGSTITVRMDEQTRLIELQKGEALFAVHHENKRAFIVEINNLRVTDIGTRFDVRKDHDRILVSVTEGVVEIERKTPRTNIQIAASDGDPIRLVEGQQAVQFSNGDIETRSFDVLQETAWKQGNLVFREDDLATVIAEVNRYFSKPLRLETMELSELHFSGVLQISDQDRAVHDLTTLLPLIATDTGPEIVLSKK
jgi:transmembrane sensor